MDITKDDPIQFLDFTGLEDSERISILSSLHSTDSNHRLPWIITQSVPTKNGNQKNDFWKSEHQSHIKISIQRNDNMAVPHDVYTAHLYDQSQFHSICAPSITPKFNVTPVAPFSVPYPSAVIPMAPIYTSFHHSPQGLHTNSPSLNSAIYSPDPVYPYAQVSPVPHAYDTLSQFSHSTQYNCNMPNQPPCQEEYNDSSSALVSEEILPSMNNIPTHQVHGETTHINPTHDIPQPIPTTNSNDNSPNFKIQKNFPLEKPMHPSPTVSYGVPNSSPFPTNRENKPTVIPSPSVNKTENEKDQSYEAETEQNGIATNGHATVVTVSSGNKSWASLFNPEPSTGAAAAIDKTIHSTMQKSRENENSNVSCPIKNPRRSQFLDPTCYRMGEYLLSHSVDGKTISLQPRGLINRSNYCYINSILQALLACPPLYNLLCGLSKQVTSNEKRKPTPVIDGMCKLVREFEHLPAGQRVGRRTDKNQKKEAGTSVNCGIPFEPTWIYKMLNGMRSDSFLIEGRQEDAEEFFGCLLNGLNDEIQELMKLVSNDTEEIGSDAVPETEQESEDWQVIGPKNKGSITRKTAFGRTPISNIFGGLLRSRIHRAGDESTNNIQPFFTLQLNIEKAKTVAEALEGLATKNQLEGVTSSKTNEQVEAWQQVMIEELPVVLVLHLKCFDYQLNGCTKIMKTLEFPIDLKIDSKLLSSKMNSSKEKQYKLFAVVYHDGKEASKGHYLTDAFHVGYNSWLRYDDASVKAVSEEHVLSPQGSRVPYLLFYRRCDTIRSK